MENFDEKSIEKKKLECPSNTTPDGDRDKIEKKKMTEKKKKNISFECKTPESKLANFDPPEKCDSLKIDATFQSFNITQSESMFGLNSNSESKEFDMFLIDSQTEKIHKDNASRCLLENLKSLYEKNFGLFENPKFAHEIGLSLSTFYRHINGEINAFKIQSTYENLKNIVYKNWLPHNKWTTPQSVIDSIFKQYEGYVKDKITQDINEILFPYIENDNNNFGYFRIGLRFTNHNNVPDLKRYAKIIVNSYKNEILEARRKLGFPLIQTRLIDMPPLTRQELSIKGIDIDTIVEERSKYLWYGLVYETDDLSKNMKYSGMTITTTKKRWILNVKIALNETLRHKWNEPIIAAIREFLFGDIQNNNLGLTIEDLTDTNGNWNWKKIFTLLGQNFKTKVEIICFDDNSLRESEKNYIRENNLLVEGYNIREGGGGGPKVILLMLKVAYLIAMGNDQTEITNILNENYKIKCSWFIVFKRIKDYWQSFWNAQIKFFRPMLEMLLKARFKLGEINDAFGKYILNRIEDFFDGYTYISLIRILDKDWSNISPKQPKFWRAYAFKQYIPYSILKQMLIKYVHSNDACNDSMLKSYILNYKNPALQLSTHTYQHFGLGLMQDWNEARKQLIAPIIMLSIRKNTYGYELLKLIGYSEDFARKQTLPSFFLD